MSTPPGDRNRIGEAGFTFECCRSERQGREEKEKPLDAAQNGSEIPNKTGVFGPPTNGRVDEIGAAR
jgi:hypothetical protein